MLSILAIASQDGVVTQFGLGGLLVYTVVKDSLAYRRRNGNGGTKPGTSPTCIKHGEAIVGLQRDVKYIREKVDYLCKKSESKK